MRPGDVVVVTGGAGFIGSQLVSRLVKRGCSVHVLDDLSANPAAEVPHLEALQFHRVEVGADDFSLGLLCEIVAEAKVVFHLASPMGVGNAHRHPVDTGSRILKAGLAVVEACRKLGRPLLHTSSSEVYGAQLQPVRETTPTQLQPWPRHSYAAAKVAIEHLVGGLTSQDGIPTWNVRFFNVSGPGHMPGAGHVVPSFVRAALVNEPLLIYGDGQHRRTFVHVFDAVDALLQLVDTGALSGEVVNVGGSCPVTVTKLAQLVVDLLGGVSPIQYEPFGRVFGARFLVIPERVPDTARMRTATSWKPTRTLEQIILDCAGVLRARLVKEGASC